MKRRRSPTRVILKAAAVWELPDQLDMSQNEPARRCGITSGHLSLLMNGRRSPSPQVRRPVSCRWAVDKQIARERFPATPGHGLAYWH